MSTWTPENGKYVLYIDGSSLGNPGPGGSGYVITDLSGKFVKEGSKHLSNVTNNQAEYHALILGLREAMKLGIKDIDIVTDSELLARQLNGLYRVKSPNISGLFRRAKKLLEEFNWSVRWVKREENKRADQLAFHAAHKRK